MRRAYWYMILFVVGSTSALVSARAEESFCFECCDLLHTLSRFTVQAKGDVMRQSECSQNAQICTQRHVIKKFMEQTKAMLQESINSVTTNGTQICMSTNAFLQRTQDILLLAFLGRTVSTDTECLEQMGMELDSTSLLKVRISDCATEKTIYTTLVVASISLLIFFIACEVVHKEQQIKDAQPAPNATKLNCAATPLMLRMRII